MAFIKIIKARNIGGVVLAITVKRGYQVIARSLYARPQSRGLSAAVVMAQNAQGGIFFFQRTQDFIGAVRAAIIDINNFTDRRGFRRADNFIEQRGYIFFLVQYGNNYSNHLVLALSFVLGGPINKAKLKADLRGFLQSEKRRKSPDF